jgi:hypothetical protein
VITVKLQTKIGSVCLLKNIHLPMQTFNIQLQDKNYGVEPQENGTYRILDGEEKIGVVYPEPGTLGVEWKTMDELEPGFVAQLGDLISENQQSQSASQ